MFDIFYLENQPTQIPTAVKVESIEHAQKLARTRYFWIVDYLCDYSEWDFLWEPAPWEADFKHAWPSQWQKDSGTYLIPKTGYSEVKYNVSPQVKRFPSTCYWNSLDFEFDYSWHPDSNDPPYIYQFGTQWQKTGGPKYVIPGATDIKYVNLPRVNKTSVDNCWVLPKDVEFDDFDYTWHPDDTDPPYVYQFATQHQKTGGPQYVLPDAKETKFVDEIKIKTHKVATGIVVIKHLNATPRLETDIPVIENTRFISNYLGTLRRVLEKIHEHEYVWVVSDLCDYSDFDFSWHPEIWQNTMLHVFPSNEQKFGDTFFIHIPSFLEKSQNIEVLEWFNTLNFVQEQPVKRKDPQLVKFTQDTLVDAVWQHTFTEPLVQFYRYQPQKPITVSLWQERLRTVVPLNKSGEATIVPRDAKNYIRTQVYDYQWIDKTLQKTNSGTPQDIVYISYDEPEAEQNWNILQERTKQLPNRLTRIHGVAGMENALKAASEASETPWVYNVFAKTELDTSFDFSFVPDYLQSPKHYIFNCRNSSNGLVYGHMGVIMYNCNMVTNAPPYEELGLDYTVSFPVEVVPLLSCHGNFATSPYHAWRTAFRESAKLAYFNSQQPTMENQHRLDVWTSFAEGDYAEWVLNGARDGIDFFKESNGSLAYLKQSFRWEWLRARFAKKYGDLV